MQISKYNAKKVVSYLRCYTFFKLACDSITSSPPPCVPLSHSPHAVSYVHRPLFFDYISLRLHINPYLANTCPHAQGTRRGRRCYLQLYYYDPMAINNKPLLWRVLMNGKRRALLFIPVGHAIAHPRSDDKRIRHFNLPRHVLIFQFETFRRRTHGALLRPPRL